MAVILTKRRSSGGSGAYANVFIANENAVGVRDNDNRIFTTAYSYITGTLLVNYNGQRLVKDNDYKEQSSNKFRLVYVKPYNDDNLVVDYQIPT